jgi:hypothetical protein
MPTRLSYVRFRGGGSLLLQCFGKVLPSFSEFASVFFELLF